MSVTRLRILYPEFADLTAYPDAVADIFYQEAQKELCRDTWATFFERGTMALAAHLMAVAKRSANGANSAFGAGVANINNIKTGDEQVAFAAVGAATGSPHETSLRTTPYGLEYIRLAERILGHPIMV